jgi:hypothetical protein
MLEGTDNSFLFLVILMANKGSAANRPSAIFTRDRVVPRRSFFSLSRSSSAATSRIDRFMRADSIKGKSHAT